MYYSSKLAFSVAYESVIVCYEVNDLLTDEVRYPAILGLLSQ